MTPIEQMEPEITVASTTDTQEQIDHAVSDKWREHFDPSKVVEMKPGESGEKKSETKTDAASEADKTGSKEGKSGTEDKGEQDDLKDLPPGARKRIDRLTARAKKAEEELERVRTERTDKKTETVKPATASDPEPELKDFKTWEEWNAAHNRWIVRDENRKETAKQAETSRNEAMKQTYDSHLERVEAGRAAHDDFDEAVKEMGTFEFASEMANRAFQLAIVEAENSAEVLYHLAKNPEAMEKFATLSPVRVQMEIGRLSAALLPSSADDKKTPDTKAQSKTPPPPTRVKSSTAAPASLNDPNLDTDSFIRLRNEQEAKERRRR